MLFLFLYLVTKTDLCGRRFFPRYFYTRNLIDICSELCNNQLKKETLTRTRDYYKVGAVNCSRSRKEIHSLEKK